MWKRKVNKYVTIHPETGTVKKGESQEFEIVYLPITEHKLKSYKCQLEIVSGPKYDIFLFGEARKPGIELSFTEYEFGHCFVMNVPMSKTIKLEMINRDNSAITIETSFEKKPYLDVQLAPGTVILPSTKDKIEKIEIPIIFTPRVLKKYDEIITFDFNGIYKIDVHILGEGIPMIVTLQDPEQQTVNFGVVSVGGDVTKKVNLINKSKKSLTFNLECETEYENNAISFNKEPMTIKPKEVLPIEI